MGSICLSRQVSHHRPFFTLNFNAVTEDVVSRFLGMFQPEYRAGFLSRTDICSYVCLTSLPLLGRKNSSKLKQIL
uniref:Uncharacterized protein n=1 Tax=Daphnia magna TaxID=35525 RepID=A0A0P6H958_9CRUS